MENQEEQFIKGFNVGYQLSKYDPELLAQLTKAKGQHSEYLKAMELGASQHDSEQLLEQLKISQARNRDKGRSK